MTAALRRRDETYLSSSRQAAQPAHFCILAALLSVCLLPGCGTQGPPQPPRVEQPEKVTDFTAVQVGHSLEISFTLPRLATDGERLTKPLEIELLRSLMPAGAPAANPPAPWVTLLPNQWSQSAQSNKVYHTVQLSTQEYTDWSGQTLALAVRTRTRGFRGRPHESELSNLIEIPLLDVPAPVKDMKSQVTETAIELTWTQPTRSLRGQAVRDLAGYRVYRSATGKPGSFRLLGNTDTPHYADREFQFGHTYFYKVRALAELSGKASESEDSLLAEVQPVDTFPPAAPAGLTAVYAAGAVELVWNANSESDLAGYIVYRRLDGENPRRLNKDLLSTPIYRDPTVQPGRKYFYYLTAVDRAGNASAPSQEVEVETQ